MWTGRISTIFYDLERLPGPFDVISCYEVVEHLTPSVGLNLFTQAFH